MSEKGIDEMNEVERKLKSLGVNPNTASDQPEYRTLGPDEEILGSDRIRITNDGKVIEKFVDAWSVHLIGTLPKLYPAYTFHRPIAAEKREDTRTCGELSCDECNERYQKAIAEISTLHQQLAQVQKQFGVCSVCGFIAWKSRETQPDVEDCQYCALQKQLAQEKEEKIATERQADIYRQETHRWKEALHKTETDRDNLREALIKVREICRNNFILEGGKVEKVLMLSDAALQQSEGK